MRFPLLWARLRPPARPAGAESSRGADERGPLGDLPELPPLSVGRGARGNSPPSRREPVTITFDPAGLRSSVIMVLLLVFAARLATWAFGRVNNLLLMLLLAWLLAISLETPVAALVRRGMRRGVAVGLVMFGGFVLLAGSVTAFGGAFFSQMAGLAVSIPGFARDFVEWLNRTFGLTFDPQALYSTLRGNTSQIATLATNLAGGIVGVITSIAGAIFQIAATVLFAYYLAADGPRLRRAIGGLLPGESQRVFVHVWETTLVKTGGFVVSKLLLAAVSTVAHGVLFALIDVPFWLPWAIWVGFTSQFIPTVGTYIGVVLPVLATVFTSPWHALIIAVFATVYQQVENYILIPRVSRRTMDIHPAVAFGSVLFGFALFGWVGGLIAIPLTAAILSVVSVYGPRYELIPELALTDEQAAAQLVADEAAAPTPSASPPARPERFDAEPDAQAGGDRPPPTPPSQPSGPDG